MYYVIFKDSDGYQNISRFKFETLDEALSYCAGFSAECDAKVLEEYKTISQRLVIKKKPEPVWRELAIPPEPTGKHYLAELLQQKLNGG